MVKTLKMVEVLKIKKGKKTECDGTIELELKLENNNCVYYKLNDHEKALFYERFYPVECMKITRYCFAPYFAISKGKFQCYVLE